MLRVLWVVKGLGPGGAETLLIEAARAADMDRFTFECAYVLPYKDHLAGKLEDAGVVTHCLSTRRSDPLWPYRLARLVRDGGWDVVHTHSPLPGSVARMAAWSMGSERPRLIATEHNGWQSFSAPTRHLNRITLPLSDQIYAVTDEARLSMGRLASKTTTLIHGIDVAGTGASSSSRGRMRDELGLASDDFVIGTVANFRAQKDHPNLLGAARALLDRGVDARWIIVGQGPLEAETRARATELGLDGHVTFTGFRGDAVDVMSTFDVFTLASAWEGLPVAIMDALALGLPIAATDVGGITEELTDGTNALLVPPGTPTALADAWERLSREPDLRDRLSESARTKAEDFDAAVTQRTLESTYRRVVPRPATPPDTASVPGSKLQSGLDIRPASMEDRAEILVLLRDSMGRDEDSRFADLYRWKHDENPFGVSPTWVAEDHGRIAGVRVMMRWEFVRDGEVLRAARAVDTATHPDYQGRGLFRALTMHAIDELRSDGVEFIFNTPNDQSRPGYLKMGWRDVGRLPCSIRVNGLQSLPKIMRSRMAASHWSEPLDLGVPFGDWVNTAPTSWFEPVQTSRHLSTNTSTTYYRWRFGSGPLRYRALASSDGAVATRLRRRGRALELVESTIFGNPAAAHEIETDAMRQMQATHTLRIGPGSIRGPWRSVPLGPRLTWRSISSNGMPPLPNWDLTMADVELF